MTNIHYGRISFYLICTLFVYCSFISLLFPIIGIDYSLEYAITAVMVAVGLTISQFVISMLQHWEQFTRIYLEIPT
jgi:hypothetical protein